MRIALVLTLAALGASGQPTNIITSPHLTVLVDKATGQVVAPTNFWSANSTNILASVPPPVLFLDASNIVSGVIDPTFLPPGQTQWPWEAITNPPSALTLIGFQPATNGAPVGEASHATNADLALGGWPTQWSWEVITNPPAFQPLLGFTPATNGAPVADAAHAATADVALGGWPTQWSWGAITNQPNLQTSLGFQPATNSFTGITNALGFAPATNSALATLASNVYTRTLVVSNQASVGYLTNSAGGFGVGTNGYVWASGMTIGPSFGTTPLNVKSNTSIYAARFEGRMDLFNSCLSGNGDLGTYTRGIYTATTNNGSVFAGVDEVFAYPSTYSNNCLLVGRAVRSIMNAGASTMNSLIALSTSCTKASLSNVLAVTEIEDGPVVSAGSTPVVQGVHLRNVNTNGGGTVTTQYGLRVDSLTAGTTNWAVCTEGSTPSYFGGQVNFGTASNILGGFGVSSVGNVYAANAFVAGLSINTNTGPAALNVRTNAGQITAVRVDGGFNVYNSGGAWINIVGGADSAAASGLSLSTPTNANISVNYYRSGRFIWNHGPGGGSVDNFPFYNATMANVPLALGTNGNVAMGTTDPYSAPCNTGTLIVSNSGAVALNGILHLRTYATQPAAASANGACAIWNSNGTPYLLSSAPGTTAWSGTNKLSGGGAGAGGPSNYSTGAENHGVAQLLPYSGTNYFIDFGQSYQRLDTGDGIALRYSQNAPSSTSTGAVVTIYIAPTNVMRRLALYDAATNWLAAGIQAPMVIPGNCAVTLRATSWGPGETNVSLSAAMQNATYSYDNYTSFSPLSIPSCILWLDAAKGCANNADGSGPSANGTYVRSWADQSGNGNTVTNSTAVNVFKLSAGPNGLPCVTFTGSDPNTSMRSRAVLWPKPSTVFVVFSNRLQNPNYIINSSEDYMLFGVSASQWRFGGAGNLGAIGGPFPSNKFSLASLVYNGALSEMRTNGATYWTGDITTTSSPNAISVGGGFNGQGMMGDICEIIIYNSLLSAPNIQAVEKYLLTKYGPLPQ